MASTTLTTTGDRVQDYESGTFRSIRALVWVYVLMLLFEGAFRKWITPGLSSPLMIIRDPVVILIYAMAISGGVFPTNRFMVSLCGIAALAALFGLLAEQFVPQVYLFGFRTNFLHLPLIFIIARVMNEKHVVQIGRWWLILAIPMSILIVKQFEGGADSILNTCAGGTGVQINTSGMKIRASGTFSFVSGVVSFCGMTAAFLLYSLLKPKTYPLWLQLAGAASLIVSVSTSGSRSAVGAVVAVSVVALCAVVLRPAMLLRTLLGLTFIAAIWAAVFQMGSVQDGTQVMSMRFEEAGGHQGIWPRLFGGFYKDLLYAFDAPLLGGGLGRGTNAGAQMAVGKVDFGMGEDEWSRLLLESGPLVGLLFIGWRVALVFFLARICIREVKAGNALPFFLLGAHGMTILNGQWGQPTTLGFAALGGGLCLAAANGLTANNHPPILRPNSRNSHAPVRKLRGRSPYAEALHGHG